MKTIASLTAALIASVALVGCGKESVSTPTVESPKSPTNTPEVLAELRDFVALDVTSVASAPTPPAPPAPVSFVDSVQSGIEYTYYSDGSCGKYPALMSDNKKCVTFEEYRELCAKTEGITVAAGRMLGNYDYRFQALYNGGSTDDIRYGWSGNSCQVSVTVSGIYNGTSSRAMMGGDAATFILSRDGKILVSYISVR